LNAAGCALVGGHTSEGVELSLGFSITGEASPSHLLYKNKNKRKGNNNKEFCVLGDRSLKEGGREEEGGNGGGVGGGTDMTNGDGGEISRMPPSTSPPSLTPSLVLLLTKALGTGTLLAAEGQGEGEAGWEEGVVASMLQSNASAAKILWEVGQATAATDVTGFGLLGHLGEMMKGGMGGGGKKGEREEGGACVRLFLPSLPALPGAEACFAKGITSSLAPANERHAQNLLLFPSPPSKDSTNTTAAATAVAAAAAAAAAVVQSHLKYPLLFDPQTAGGLLASVVPEKVEATVAALRAAGYGAACVIGEVWREARGEEGGREGKVELVLDGV